MKTTWDELMRYAPEKEYPLPALERGEQERILNKTMKKLEKTKKRPARPVRTALLAAAIAALLCGTAFAAYTNGWFGFDRLFGEKTALIEGKPQILGCHGGEFVVKLFAFLLVFQCLRGAIFVYAYIVPTFEIVGIAVLFFVHIQAEILASVEIISI